MAEPYCDSDCVESGLEYTVTCDVKYPLSLPDFFCLMESIQDAIDEEGAAIEALACP